MLGAFTVIISVTALKYLFNQNNLFLKWNSQQLTSQKNYTKDTQKLHYLTHLRQMEISLSTPLDQTISFLSGVGWHFHFFKILIEDYESKQWRPWSNTALS